VKYVRHLVHENVSHGGAVNVGFSESLTRVLPFPPPSAHQFQQPLLNRCTKGHYPVLQLLWIRLFGLSKFKTDFRNYESVHKSELFGLEINPSQGTYLHTTTQIQEKGGDSFMLQVVYELTIPMSDCLSPVGHCDIILIIFDKEYK
jgi:hypothetical protein